MTIKAKKYIAAVIALGVMVLGDALFRWQSENLSHYVCYLLLAIAASTLKVEVPRVDGTFSLHFLFVLIGVAVFGYAETVTMGCASIVAQCVWRTKRKPNAVQVAFNVASMAVSIAVAFGGAHLLASADSAPHLLLMMAIASCLFFVVNTLSVSGVLAVTEQRPLGEVWQQWFLWSFPYYLAGAALAAVIGVSIQAGYWK